MPSIRPRSLLACALLLPIAVVACERATDDPDPEPVTMHEPAAGAVPADVEAATDRFVAAWNGDDPAAVARLFTEDATATVGDDTFRGRDDIEARWLTPAVPTISNLELMEGSARQEGADWRTEGTYTHDTTTPDGETVADQGGGYTFTWTRDADGQWRVRSVVVRPA